LKLLRLEAVTIRGADRDQRLPASAVFAMIGARPRTDWIGGFVGVHDRGFVVTGEDARRHGTSPTTGVAPTGHPSLLESTRRDVFAVGDVRAG